MGSPVGRYAFVYRFQLSLRNVNSLSSMSLEEKCINQLLRLSTFTKTRIYRALYLTPITPACQGSPCSALMRGWGGSVLPQLNMLGLVDSPLERQYLS